MWCGRARLKNVSASMVLGSSVAFIPRMAVQGLHMEDEGLDGSGTVHPDRSYARRGQTRTLGAGSRSSGSLASSAVMRVATGPARDIGRGLLDHRGHSPGQGALVERRLPSTAKYMVAPSAHMSAAGPLGSPLACSGAT